MTPLSGRNMAKPADLGIHSYFLAGLQKLPWQRSTRDGAKDVAIATARISRLEGMEGHARTADIRLSKYFPGENFDLSSED